jgi:hypothetical protein
MMDQTQLGIWTAAIAPRGIHMSWAKMVYYVLYRRNDHGVDQSDEISFHAQARNRHETVNRRAPLAPL